MVAVEQFFLLSCSVFRKHLKGPMELRRRRPLDAFLLNLRSFRLPISSNLRRPPAEESQAAYFILIIVPNHGRVRRSRARYIRVGSGRVIESPLRRGEIGDERRPLAEVNASTPRSLNCP